MSKEKQLNQAIGLSKDINILIQESHLKAQQRMGIPNCTAHRLGDTL